jgi:predicted RNA polymerase sigma factor
LILTCCHPALSREAQVALTLRAVCGFTTEEIARAFLVREATVAQRLVRAKRKIASAGIPYRMPSHDELEDRLDEVFAVLYLLFNEAHLSTSREGGFQRDLAEDAVWLCELLCRLLPGEPEALGLLALMKIHLARGESRFDGAGRLVLLADQDRSRWDRAMIAVGIGLIQQAAAVKRPGPYQLEAAIAACHAEAPSLAQTDWLQIVTLYDMLLSIAPSPVVRLNRAIAIWHLDGAEPAVRELDLVGDELDGYHLFHATRGELLTAVGHHDRARAARLRALDLTHNRAERSLLEQRLFH